MASQSFLTGVRAGDSVALVNERTKQPVVTAVEVAATSAARRRGLLGRDSLDPSAALIIAPCSAIHMFFMRFAIDAVFVDRGGRVLKVAHNVRPWRLAASLGAYVVIEMSAGTARRADVAIGDRLFLRA